jgi:hypothetical protein
MLDTKLLLLGTLVAASSLVIGSVGCGDDDSDDATGGTGATGASSSGTGATGNTGNTGGNPSGGGTPSTGGGGSGDGGSGGGVSAACTTYCDTVATNCTDANDQWGETLPGMCEAVCGTWAAGMPDDDMGNTVACHQYHAAASAEAGAEVHCPHAGPTGDGFCGDLCENFCELAGEVCADTFADNATCMTECEAFDDMPTYSGATVSGDSYACRMYHLTAAAVDPAGHCAHIITASDACN